MRPVHAVLFALLAACGEFDAAGPDAGDPTCLAGTYDIDKSWGYMAGPYAITGTVTLPAQLEGQGGFQINTVRQSPSIGNTVDFASVALTTNTVTYRARGLVDGTWSICLRADANGNNKLDDVGIDYAGCFGGTVAAPVASPQNGLPIVLSGMCQSGADFGLGFYN